MKVVLIREFLTQYGGAERVLDALLELFPEAPIFTLVYNPETIGHRYAKRDIRPSVLQSLPLARSHHKWYLPLMPWAVDQIELPKDIDLVISDSSSYAKGVKAPPGVPHLCYLHTPTRYLWTVRDEYVRDAPIPSLIRPLVGPILDAQKRWDYLAAQRPDFYIANSQNIAGQLERYYDRTADAVLFPFVDVDRFKPSNSVDDYVLVLGRLEPYKRTDLIIEACIKLGWRLKVAGGGSWLERYRQRYGQHRNVDFLGRVPDEALPSLYARAKVFVFPAEEDAGITPLEAMASGRPVLAYAKGGVLESIKAGVTGEFFTQQTADGIAAALTKFDWMRYTPSAIRAQAERFDVKAFKAGFMDCVKDAMKLSTVNHQLSSN